MVYIWPYEAELFKLVELYFGDRLEMPGYSAIRLEEIVHNQS